ncbi:MAG: hypothetical protein AAF741_02265 [Bacteroidota bacterium]
MASSSEASFDERFVRQKFLGGVEQKVLHTSEELAPLDASEEEAPSLKNVECPTPLEREPSTCGSLPDECTQAGLKETNP